MESFVNPKDMANELFLLFKRTSYECNLRKLQKLIIFTDMIYYVRSKKTKRLLSDSIITANDCGLAINSIMTPPYSIVINYLNDDKVILDNEIDDSDEINLASVYNYDPNALKEEIKGLLRFTFCEFGALHGDYLTLMTRKTKLWKIARDDGTQEHYITKELYDKHLQFETEIELIDYLKALVKDEQHDS